MRITKELQDEYRANLGLLAELSSEYVGGFVEAYLEKRPGASVAEVREAAMDALRDSVGSFGQQAAEVSRELFDYITRAEGLDASSRLYETTDMDMMMSKVHYLAGKLIDYDYDGFTRSIRDLAMFYIQREAFENMIRNCEANEIRWARVPTGLETCSFCFMLASRGFDYHTRQTAEQSHSKHVHCDCIVIPGVKGVTVIDGYNPDAMYDRWKQCAETVGVDEGNADAKRYRQEILDEASKRDRKWLYSSDPNYKCAVDVQSGAKPKKKERDVADTLAKMGFETYFLKPIGSKGKHTADAIINGQKWEIKQPVGDRDNMSIGKNTIDHQFEEASKQSRKIILDITVIEEYPSVGQEAATEIAKELFEGKWKSSFDELIIYGKDGIRRYINA